MTNPTPSSATGERAEFVESGGGVPPRRPRPRRRRSLLAAAVVVVVLAGAGAYAEWTNPDGISLSHPLGHRHHAPAGAQDNAAATSTATVRRRSLSQTTSVSGTLGYAGDYTVLAPGHGTVTWLPAVGQVIHERQVLYRADGEPVVLLYGSTPAYRTLAEGATASDVTGQDVKQLNRDLVALGYVSSSELDPKSDEFSSATTMGVERMQDALGVTATGTLALGSYVFLPTAARVTAVGARLGGQAGGVVLTASSTVRQVTVDLDAAQQAQVKAGDDVTITLPNNQTTPGRVVSVGKVATAPSISGGPGGPGGTPTITVQITPANPQATGTLDQAPVQVAITTATVHNVLVVPVAALLAQVKGDGEAGGGYAVEVVGSDGTHHLVPVTLGLFDDDAGLVQVTGSGLAAGQHVVVPAS
jgi:Putative peptidoglycan binding domain